MSGRTGRWDPLALADASARFSVELVAAGVGYLLVLGGTAVLSPGGSLGLFVLMFSTMPGFVVAFASLSAYPTLKNWAVLVGVLAVLAAVGYLVVVGLERAVGPFEALSPVTGSVEALPTLAFVHVAAGLSLVGVVTALLVPAYALHFWYDRRTLLGIPGLPERSPPPSYERLESAGIDEVVWACPPLAALIGALAWATVRGTLGGIALGVAVVAAGSVLVRTAPAVVRTGQAAVSGVDGETVSPGSVAAWFALTLPVAVAVVAGLANRSESLGGGAGERPAVGATADAWASVFGALFGAVEAVTPFAVVGPGAEAALLAVAPGASLGVVVSAGRALGVAPTLAAELAELESAEAEAAADDDGDRDGDENGHGGGDPDSPGTG